MKDRIKLLLMPLAFIITYLLIKAQFIKTKKISAIRPYYNQPWFKDFWKLYPNNPDNKAKIIVYGLWSIAHHNLSVFDKVFSDCFRYNGANVKNLICCNVLPSCDSGTQDVPNKIICKACSVQRKYFLHNFPNDFLYFSQFISRGEIKDIQKEVEWLSPEALQVHKYLGVNVSRHALDSVAIAFQFMFENDNVAHIAKLRDSVFRGMITVKIAHNLFEKEKPTHLFTLHGCYASWGPFSEYLFRRGVVVYVYRKLFSPGFGYFDFPKWSDNPNDIPAKEYWEIMKGRELTKEKKEKLSTFFEAKKTCKSSDYLIFYERKKRDDEKITRILNTKNRKFVLYLHSLWDVGFEEATSLCFKNHIEWIGETIKYFLNKEDTYLIIKPHPAENSYFEQHRHGGKDLVSKLIDKLPHNIVIMENNCNYTSYDLMENGCVGITYYGTVGLEHSYFKKPILFAGNIHFTEAGAALKIKSKKEYFELINNPEPLYEYPLKNYNLIERYAYHYYFRPNIRIPFYRDDMYITGHCIDWNVLRDYEDFIKNNKTMNHIARSIINKESVVNPD